MDDFIRQLFEALFDFTFPDNDDAPTGGLQGRLFLFIAGDIAVEFRRPKFDVGFRHGRDFAAFMAMPEASVDENDGVPFWENDVGVPWQFGRMNAVTKTQRMEVMAHDNFRLRVLRADFAHGGATLFWCEGVHVFKDGDLRAKKQ